MTGKVISTSRVLSDGGPYSQAVAAGSFIFVSGQIAWGSGKGREVLKVKGGIKEQTRKTLDNIKNILREAGASLEDIVSTVVYLKDLSDYDEMDEVYRTYFPEDYPARICSQAGGMMDGILVEIGATAYKGRK